MQNKEIENLLSCDNCKLKECIGCEITYTDRKKIREYIEQLEKDKDIIQRALSLQTAGWNEGAKLFADKQKLIEKLEERIESVEKCYEKLLTDIGGIKIINVTGLSKKEKEEVINKRNCLLVQKHCYEEILKIVKGEK